MTGVDYIAIGVILLVLGGAIFYIVRAKKRGQRCIGCPHADKCASNCECKCTDKADENQEKAN